MEERSEWVKQKTLDLERQALQLIYKQKLPYLRSNQQTILDKRSYSMSQVNLIVTFQTERDSISTWLCFFGGIRAHEAATILPLAERDPSLHRVWDPRLFSGLPPHKIYTVAGKGGLVRKIAVPLWLALKLEVRRRKNPIFVRDREVNYLSHYDICFGQALSQNFTTASKKAIGFSRGCHGLRHSYAKWRLQNLLEYFETQPRIDQQCPEELALLILSQELGHFRLDITYCYLR